MKFLFDENTLFRYEIKLKPLMEDVKVIIRLINKNPGYIPISYYFFSTDLYKYKDEIPYNVLQFCERLLKNKAFL